MQRILIIRGGAIGDFILTLPALKLLRDNFPSAHIEILGYKHIIALAENRFYANATRSIEYAPLSRFFARDTKLPADLVEYFGGFDLIVSYLFDPDDILGWNLRRCGAARLILGSAKFHEREHAARQLAKPLAELGLHLTDASAFCFPNDEDRNAATHFLGGLGSPIIAIHPGSGSEKKNWPIENWIELGNFLLGGEASRTGGFSAAELPGRRSGERRSLVVVSGEADEREATTLAGEWRNNADLRFATSLPLPHLAAVLENSIFVGHDSGVSHLAAAAGAKCILLFGPTNPEVWAPKNGNVKVLRAPGGNLKALDFGTVRDAVTNVGAALVPRLC